MAKPQRPPSGRTNLASCVVATIFLVFLLIILFIVYFMLFKPQDPKIAVSAVQLPSFSVSNGTVSFAFSQYASVRNPNRGTFSHYDSSLQLFYYGKQVGFMFVPAGKIDAGRTEYMAATFTVQSLPLGPGPTTVDGPNRLGPVMEIESRIEMAGRVRVLHLFSHHVEAKAGCRVAIAVSTGSVLGFQC
ncbi:Late embryogenesis abundant protein [Sesbania bispinosa]|nr:Late embryogenesis abundant protein [Sesbania bispinosa]